MGLTGDLVVSNINHRIISNVTLILHLYVSDSAAGWNLPSFTDVVVTSFNDEVSVSTSSKIMII